MMSGSVLFIRVNASATAGHTGMQRHNVFSLSFRSSVRPFVCYQTLERKNVDKKIQLSQRDRAMLRVTHYFAESLTVI